MHYYQLNIADYRKDTVHLTPIEHYIYRSLIDQYYLDEKPISTETQVVIRRLSLGMDMVENLTNVLTDFFKLEANGWHHKRIDLEIIEFHSKVKKNQINGKLGGRPKKTQVVIDGFQVANPSESESNPNQEPVTINQEPLLNTSGKKASPAKASSEPLPIPDFVKLENWNDFIEVRKGLKAKNTIQAMKALITQLNKIVSAGDDADEVVLQSIRSSWKDLYPIKKQANGAYQNERESGRKVAAASVFKPEHTQHLQGNQFKTIEAEHETKQIAG